MENKIVASKVRDLEIMMVTSAVLPFDVNANLIY